MDDSFIKQAMEWLGRGSHDIETAQLLYDNRGHIDSIAFHIHQALEKYLKGYLIFFGKKPPKIHDLGSLLNHIIFLDDSFAGYRDLCEKSTLYYIDSRYPPGPLIEYTYTEIKGDLDESCELIRVIYEKIENINK